MENQPHSNSHASKDEKWKPKEITMQLRLHSSFRKETVPLYMLLSQNGSFLLKKGAMAYCVQTLSNYVVVRITTDKNENHFSLKTISVSEVVSLVCSKFCLASALGSCIRLSLSEDERFIYFTVIPQTLSAEAKIFKNFEIFEQE